MSEMSHVKVAENLERLANDFEEVGTPGNAKILRSAATNEHRIANLELVEVVHAHWAEKTTPWNMGCEKYLACSNCGARQCDTYEDNGCKFCDCCGALMDESRTGNSLNGKDDNHATN